MADFKTPTPSRAMVNSSGVLSIEAAGEAKGKTFVLMGICGVALGRERQSRAGRVCVIFPPTLSEP